MLVSENAKRAFAERVEKVKALISQSDIKYEEVGIFGSYARGTSSAASDIDFCIITPEPADRRSAAQLREEAELIGADISFVTRSRFETDESLFIKNLRRDYKRVI